MKRAVPRIATHIRVYRQVADDLEKRIVSGEFPAGHRLPTERVLAEDYGVSRTCLREALLALEIAGLVSIRVGSGVYVTQPREPDQPVEFVIADQHSPSDLLEARLVIEPELCALAASRASPQEIEAIAESVRVMREEHRMAAETERGDREFHRLIAQASCNSVLQRALAGIWEEMTGPMWQGLQKHIRSPILRLQWIEDHEAILEALQGRDSRRARTAMRNHIKRVRDALDSTRFQ